MRQQIGACGVHCGSCPTFKLDHDRCLGCDWANKMLRKSRESKKGCTFWECVEDKDVECCFSCDEFPCQTHYDQKEAIYTRQALDMWKELKKTGLTFSGRREELEKSIRDDSEDK